ncbi:hypothetical protein Ga0061061_11736 [Chelatococcus sambhunathii]|uniref:Uncharacterized protein n=1 Tax=Chelatococcus sambhunathii TaxID=363953 RepID=A0ABP2ACH3_9HYPH|nr:hypothetical protein [Chelatococcus sambhunathii]CUA90990.1 hypothetical protein Ga0061061_11736 [Chelatococcus sambhunathii]
MKDIFGVTLEVGQTVAACIQPYRNRYDLIPATVIGFTPKMVRLDDGRGRHYLISHYKLAVVKPA